MTKVAIKNENITSFGGIYHIMDVFSKLGFEKLTESVLGKRGSSGKAFCYGSIFGSLFFRDSKFIVWILLVHFVFYEKIVIVAALIEDSLGIEE